MGIRKNPPSKQRRDTIANLRMALTFIFYGLAFAVAVVLIDRGTIPPGQATIVALALVGAIGVATILVFQRYLQQLDEMQRRIQLGALGYALGGCLLWGTTTPLLTEARMIDHVSQSWVVVVMAVGYSIGVAIGTRRFL